MTPELVEDLLGYPLGQSWMYLLFLMNQGLANTYFNLNTNPTPWVCSLDLIILYPSDHPRLVFVNTSFIRENFVTWKSAKETALYAKSKGDFIDGSLAVPDLTSPDFQRWKKNMMQW